MVRNQTIDVLLGRHTTRRFSGMRVDPELADAIVECGNRAPSALGRKDPLIVACDDARANLVLGRISRQLATERERGLATHVSSKQPSIVDDPTIEDAFYGAPLMVYGFTPGGWEFGREDAAIAADAMMVAAASLGLGTCYVSRARETFERDAARGWARAHGVSDAHEGAFALCVGWPA